MENAFLTPLPLYLSLSLVLSLLRILGLSLWSTALTFHFPVLCRTKVTGSVLPSLDSTFSSSSIALVPPLPQFSFFFLILVLFTFSFTSRSVHLLICCLSQTDLWFTAAALRVQRHSPGTSGTSVAPSAQPSDANKGTGKHLQSEKDFVSCCQVSFWSMHGTSV